MTNTLVITGIDKLSDQSFTLDASGFPEIIWNSTRLERDAFLGRFGAPCRGKFSELHDYGPDYDSWKHLDRARVERFIVYAYNWVTRPDWETKGTMSRNYQLIDIPGITIALPQADGRLHGFPADGNHRMKAREVMGLKTFQRFIVPPELESEYRITMREI